MRQENKILTSLRFSIGPFSVLSRPRYDSPYYRYILSVSGVPVRQQTSYPEVTDGWIGLATTLENYNDTLSAEDKEKLLAFRRSWKYFQLRIEHSKRSPSVVVSPWRQYQLPPFSTRSKKK